MKRIAVAVPFGGASASGRVEVLMDGADGAGTFSNGGSDSLHRSGANVPCGKNSRLRCLEGQGQPSVVGGDRHICENEAFGVELDQVVEPIGERGGTDKKK